MGASQSRLLLVLVPVCVGIAIFVRTYVTHMTNQLEYFWCVLRTDPGPHTFCPHNSVIKRPSALQMELPDSLPPQHLWTSFGPRHDPPFIVKDDVRTGEFPA